MITCCNCIENIYINCSCSVFRISCISTSCCWCCYREEWLKTIDSKKIYEVLFNDVLVLIKRQKHLKTLKKLLSKLTSEISTVQRRYLKLESIDFHSLLEEEEHDEQRVFDEMQTNLAYKIRYQLNEWELIIEICLVLLGLQTEYINTVSYHNLLLLTSAIEHGLFELTKVFTTIVQTEFNMSLYRSNKEKILDIENNLTVLEVTLAKNIKIDQENAP